MTNFKPSLGNTRHLRARHQGAHCGYRWHLAPWFHNGGHIRKGALLTFDEPLADPNLKEFFLMLSSNGSVYRRCELRWIDSCNIGTQFVTQTQPATKKPKIAGASFYAGATLGARPYLIAEGTLDECIRQFMSKPASQHHLYEILTAPQQTLVTAALIFRTSC